MGGVRVWLYDADLFLDRLDEVGGNAWALNTLSEMLAYGPFALELPVEAGVGVDHLEEIPLIFLIESLIEIHTYLPADLIKIVLIFHVNSFLAS
jgi:hypothetical protein